MVIYGRADGKSSGPTWPPAPTVDRRAGQPGATRFLAPRIGRPSAAAPGYAAEHHRSPRRWSARASVGPIAAGMAPRMTPRGLPGGATGDAVARLAGS